MQVKARIGGDEQDGNMSGKTAIAIMTEYLSDRNLVLMLVSP